MRMRIGFILLLGLTAAGCGKTKSTDELIADLKSPEERDRIMAVRTLQGDPARVVPALMEALKDKQSDVRLSAAIKLGSFGEQAKDAVPALLKAQKDGDARVRQAAATALSRIDPSAAPAKQP